MILEINIKNPNFYPQPIDRAPALDPKAKDDFVNVTEGFLTLEELIAVHGQIGNAMHAINPYRQDDVLQNLASQFEGWKRKIVRLLNNHVVRFPGEQAFLYVGMESKERGDVHMNFFVRYQGTI